jgi:hypothetical protein
LQLAQLVVDMISPVMAGIIGLGGFVLFLWLMTAFIAELHGFRSRGLVFVGMVVSAFAAGLLIGVAVIVLIGPEALMPNV